jgi:hypothetical protein
MYMSVIQKNTRHYRCAGTAKYGLPTSVTELAYWQLSTSVWIILYYFPTIHPYNSTEKFTAYIEYSTFYFLSVCLLLESPSPAGRSSRNTFITWSIRTANTLSIGSINPCCIHLGIVVCGSGNPSLRRKKWIPYGFILLPQHVRSLKHQAQHHKCNNCNVKHRFTFLGHVTPSKPTIGRAGLKHNDSNTLLTSFLLLATQYKAQIM